MDSSPLVATQKEEEGRSEVKVIEEDLGVDHHEVAREEDLMVALLVAEAVEEDRVAAERARRFRRMEEHQHTPRRR